MRRRGLHNVTIPGAQNGAGTLTAARTRSNPHDLDTELVNARVWMGFHFRTSLVAGENLGRAATEWSLERNFQQHDDPGESDQGEAQEE